MWIWIEYFLSLNMNSKFHKNINDTVMSEACTLFTHEQGRIWDFYFTFSLMCIKPDVSQIHNAVVFFDACTISFFSSADIHTCLTMINN